MPEKDEAAFRRWYDAWASRYGMNPDPDDPRQHYDYRAAFRQGITPPNTAAGEHWPSLDKDEGHPNIVVGGFHTKTGQRVLGTPRAKTAAELEALGWDRATAARLIAQPEPPEMARQQLAQPAPRVKGAGFFGGLLRPDRRVSSELSIGVDLGQGEMDIPTLVPTLTAAEVQTLLNLPEGQPIPAPIADKAVAFARRRMAEGKSPFAEADEARLSQYPQFPRAGAQPPVEGMSYLTDLLRRMRALAQPGGGR